MKIEGLRCKLWKKSILNPQYARTPLKTGVLLFKTGVLSTTTKTPVLNLRRAYCPKNQNSEIRGNNKNGRSTISRGVLTCKWPFCPSKFSSINRFICKFWFFVQKLYKTFIGILCVYFYIFIVKYLIGNSRESD